ncbi:MAG: histidinol dehydrogenase [Candidatus Caldatribacterium sp.]|nr:histidinol dehydrogenase [Candidatus Caldatribacterium sp.]
MKIILKPVRTFQEVAKDLGVDRYTLYENLRKVEREVERIIEDVKEQKDKALREYTKKFDGCEIADFRVPLKDLEEAWEKAREDFKETIRFVASNIRAFHERQKLESFLMERPPSLLGELVRPLQRVGCYVPGGRFAYPSSCLMTVIPAQIAGVKEIALFTPPTKDGSVPQEILATAFFLEVQEVYRVGGVQAIAAACFGTETIPPVEKIVGPGNIYVTTAKKVLQGVVGIDALAGPSEVVIIADQHAPSEWIALDLLAQAEHDPLAVSVLISPSEALLFAVKQHLEKEALSAPFPKERIAPIFLYQVESLDTAIELVNVLAPEHVEIMVENPFTLLPRLRRGGAFFLGPYAPVALGDYGYGPNHVLPTGGSAAFSSPLSVRDFYTLSSFIFPMPQDPSLSYETYATLAAYEGLFFHRRSLLARVGKKFLTDIEQGWTT